MSIVAIPSSGLEENGIDKLEELQTLVPNFQLTETAISTQMYVRGIGTGANQAFEQSVSQYVDGIYYGRQQLIRLPFFDLDRVEVLRGPQGTLFGKNTIAGALSLIAAAPTQEFEGRVSLQLAEFGAQEYDVAIAGGLGEGLAGRFALRHFKEDGYVDNTQLGIEGPTRDELGMRAILDWQISPDSRLRFKAERHSFDTQGRQIEIVQDSPALPGAPLPGLTFAQILSILGHPGAITDATIDLRRQSDVLDSSVTDVENFTLTGDFTVGDLTLTSITGLVEYQLFELCDCDFVGAPIFDGVLDEEYEQVSQEVNLASPIGQDVEWIAGLFLQSNDLRYADDIRVPNDSVLGLLSGGALIPVLGTSASRDYQSESDLWAVFGQATWALSDRIRLTFGGRFTNEKKDASRILNALDQGSGLPTQNPAVPLIYTGVFGIENEQFTGHNLTGSRDESSFTPLVSLQWDITDSAMAYATASRGFKAGGFDARANTVGSFEFEEEEASSFEIGAKLTSGAGRGEFNVAYFSTDYDDWQFSQFDGTLGFVVGNAKEISVDGIEIDGRWIVSDGLTLTYSLGLLDHKFENFTNGNCYNRQIPNGDVVNGVPLCDYTGLSGQFTPEISSNLSMEYTRPVGALSFRLGGNLSFVGEHNVHLNLDPQYSIDSHYRFDLRVGLSGDRWSAWIIGENLNDERYLTYAGNTPLSGTTFGTNTFYGFISRPRTLGVRIDYGF